MNKHRGRTKFATVAVTVASMLVATAGLTGGALAGAASAPPAAPQHVTTVIGSTTVKVSWTKETSKTVTTYQVTDKPASKVCTVKSSAKAACNFSGLKASTAYTFAVRALAGKVKGKVASTTVTMGPSSTQAWKLSSDLTPGVLFNDTYLTAAGPTVATATKQQVQVTEYPANTLYSSQTLAFTALESAQIQAV